MARILVYTSPARGHLYPILGPALELAARGHDVHVLTLEAELDRVAALGLGASAIAPAVEAIEMDDWREQSARAALMRALGVFAERAPHDHADLRAAIAAQQPDALVVDDNAWGAQTAAVASGLPWAGFQPYLTPLPSPEVPPVGLGLKRDGGVVAQLRDRLLSKLMMRQMGGVALPVVNRLRAADGLPPLRSMPELLALPPRTIYFTAEPFEYSRSDWPASFVMVGAATWAPPADAPEWLAAIERPLVLVTCSTERQSDRAIVEAALTGLADEDVFVVATSAAHNPASFEPGPNARVEAFLPHDPLVRRAAAVVCHGGMGITQRALAHGVPLCVVPFGRDQVEVARHVEEAGAGVRVLPKELTPERLRDAVHTARSRTDGAARVAAAFAEAGGSARAADVVDELLAGAAVPGAAGRELEFGAATSWRPSATS
jgi:MGT family glycosyltransferase